MSTNSYWIKESANSTAVMGPLDKGCSEEVCRCTSWHHRARAQQICDLLNREDRDEPTD